MTAVLADAQNYDFGEAQWDLIVFRYVPFDGLTERVERGLKPGGIVLVETFHRDTATVRLLPERFGDNELLQAFHGFRILHYEDVLTRQDWGAQLVYKPQSCDWRHKNPNRLRLDVLGSRSHTPKRNSLLGRNTHRLPTTGLDALRFLSPLTSSARSPDLAFGALAVWSARSYNAQIDPAAPVTS